MKKFFPALVRAFLFLFLLSLVSKGLFARSFIVPLHHTTSYKSEPRASFEKIWVDYDITEGGLKGMRIHVKFTVYDMLNIDAYLAIYFLYNDEIGGAIRDKNQKFNSTAGDVAIYRSMKPLYNPAVFSDLNVFMPYNELDLDPGNYDLTMDVKLIYKEGGVIQKLTTYDFEYIKPGASSGAPAITPSATFEDLWVDYDVTENGHKGMRIHVKFTLKNMKDVDSYLAIYFEKKDGEKLKSQNTTYKSKSGQLALYKTLKPGYDESVYKDLQVFMPYSEMNLPSGRHDLKLDADIIYKNGDLIKHLKYHEFWFSH